jgi:hypothetical protein
MQTQAHRLRESGRRGEKAARICASGSARRRRAVGALAIAVLALAGSTGMVRGVEKDLPEALKRDLQQLERRLDEIERTVGRLDRAAVDLSLREASQAIDEFALDAELLETDPLIERLKKRVSDLREKSKSPKPVGKTKAPTKPAATTLKEIEALVQIPVDMNNVSFKKDVAPIIQNVCVRCHGGPDPAGDFNASTYESFIEHIEPGAPEKSRILLLVTGKAEPRMPRGGQTRFERRWAEIWAAWIRQGAKFDGPSRTAPIASFLVDLESQRRAAIANLAPDTLEKLHRSHAERQIQIVGPKTPVEFLQTDHFLVYSTLDKSDTEYAATVAEAVIEELTATFGLSKNQPLWPGRFGLNIFAERVDYESFARNIDDYDPEPTEFGHYRLRPEHQYLAMTASYSGYQIDGLVAQQVTAAFLGQLGAGRLPPWAVYGFSRFLGSRYDGRARGFRDELNAAMRLAATEKNLRGLFSESLPWVEMAPLSASLFHFLMETDKRVTIQFLKGFAQTGNCAESMAKTMRTNPDQLTRAWLAGMQGRSRR